MSVESEVAELIFDSFAQVAFGGTRGETTARQMVMRAEEFDIHIRIWTTDNGREMLGQIQSTKSESFTQSAQLYLLQDGKRIGSSQLNDLGEFHFSRVPEGFLNIQTDLPHLTVIGALYTT